MKIMENFVLKIQEREEAIQLLAMDPKVYGELLTHHRRGNGVDEEALRIRIPPPAGHQNLPQMGSCGDRSLRWRKSIFVDLSRGFGFFGDLQAEEVGADEPQGAHKPARRRPPWPRLGGLWPPLVPSALVLKLPAYLLFRKKNLFGGFISFGLRLVFSSKKGQKHGKKELALGPELISQSQKRYKTYIKHPKLTR